VFPGTHVAGGGREIDMPLRLVVFAEERRLIRESLKVLLTNEGFDVRVEGRFEAASAEAVARARPDVALLDLPPSSAVPAALAIRTAAPHTQVVVLADTAREREVTEALRAGARGYVLKSRPACELVRALHEVAGGALVLSPEASAVLTEPWRRRTNDWRDPLTPRAQEVLRLVAEGKTTKEIAHALGLSVKTAESHRTRIMEKLAIHHTAGLVRYAIRRGLIEA
jgi:DNA-binding NarL/FixJ family response regulator